MIDENSVIYQFQKEYRFLSNFYPSPMNYEDVDYPTAEHAYQAAKTVDSGLRLHIASLASPAAAKYAGKSLRLRPGWDRMKILIMRQIVEAKFSQNPDLLELLISTKPARLIEGNSWGDKFWGECPIGTGRNELGKILMTVRDDISRLL